MEFDPEAHDTFVSERFLLEAQRRSKLEAFDKFIDLALDGVITMEQAIQGFAEEYINPLAGTAITPPTS